MPTRGAVISLTGLILTLLTIPLYGGAIPYDTICSNNYYTIRGNDPVPSDTPHHYAWVVSSDGGASWQRIPNSNHRDLTITAPLADMTNMQVRRCLYKRYIFSPQQTSQSGIVGLVMAKGYTLSRTIDTVTPCVDSKGFQITTPLPATFEWQCIESGKTLQPQNVTANSTKYRIRMVDLKTSDDEFPSGFYNIYVTMHLAGGVTKTVELLSVVNEGTVNPFDSPELSYTYNNSDAFTINRNWSGLDRQEWRILSNDIGKLTVENGAGILHGVSTTFMTDVFVDAVCADYPDQHYQLHLKERVRNFPYRGSPYEIYVPLGKYTMECWGASGGGNTNQGIGSHGGLGGYAHGSLVQNAPRTFYVYVGGTGSGVTGGWNGGGNGYSTGYGGGGASDIRLTNGAWNNAASLYSRIMVAGGGGGPDDCLNECLGCENDGSGGAGGGMSGGAARINGAVLNRGFYNASVSNGGGCGMGANQTNGFSLGQGEHVTYGTDTGGGGGGFRGGYVSNHNNGGAGGGSGFVSGLTGCNAVNSSGASTGSPNHYSGVIFSDAFMEAGLRAGHGYARISYADNIDIDESKEIKNFGSYRAWRDGTYATSAEAYRHPSNGYKYLGDTGSGIYRIDPDGPNGSVQPFNVYCDMDSDGGGWTMVVAQFEIDPVTNWNEGIQSDYDPTLNSQRSFCLNSSQLPPHTYTAFGKGLNPTYAGYSQFHYSTGNIGVTGVFDIKMGYYCHIHRNTALYYGDHNPEESSGNTAEWNNTLTCDRTGGRFQTWAFSPQHPTRSDRGYALLGALYNSNDAFAWTVWVK